MFTLVSKTSLAQIFNIDPDVRLPYLVPLPTGKNSLDRCCYLLLVPATATCYCYLLLFSAATVYYCCYLLLQPAAATCCFYPMLLAAANSCCSSPRLPVNSCYLLLGFANNFVLLIVTTICCCFLLFIFCYLFQLFIVVWYNLAYTNRTKKQM